MPARRRRQRGGSRKNAASSSPLDPVSAPLESNCSPPGDVAISETSTEADSGSVKDSKLQSALVTCEENPSRNLSAANSPETSKAEAAGGSDGLPTESATSDQACPTAEPVQGPALQTKAAMLPASRGKTMPKRRRRIFREGVVPSLCHGEIRRVCRRAGILRMSRLLKWEMIGVHNSRLNDVLADCTHLVRHTGRSTVTRDVVLRALKGKNSTMYPAV